MSIQQPYITQVTPTENAVKQTPWLIKLPVRGVTQEVGISVNDYNHFNLFK